MNKSKDTDIIETELNEEGIFVPVKSHRKQIKKQIKKQKQHVSRSRSYVKYFKKESPIEEILEGFSVGLNLVSQFKNIIK
ncbi:MAG TPA: hypothetical protein ENG87_05950 [Candidatus Pacearchaeota archaeon]|nr:hypothetical protein [Candidatus Pacearchaeota archaeon]